MIHEIWDVKLFIRPQLGLHFGDIKWQCVMEINKFQSAAICVASTNLQESYK